MPQAISPKNKAILARRGRKERINILPSSNLSHIIIIKDRFIFDTRSGKFHRASESASFILGELKINAPIPEIVARYAERYSVGRAIAERDVELFLNDMSVVGMPIRDTGGALRR